MIRPTVAVLCAPMLCAQYLPTLEFSELRIRPTPGSHVAIEIIASNTPLATAGHHLVVGNTAVALPAVVVSEWSPCVLHLGVAGVNTPSDLWLPGAPAPAVADSVAWFRSNQTSNPADLVDYVAWGGAIGPQAAFAVQAGRWSAVSDSASLPAALGATLANRRFTRTTANLVGPDAWYADTTPTLGAENDPAMTWAHAIGCVTANAPSFGVTSNDPGPWLGEPATLLVAPVPSIAVLVLSTTPTSPTPLDGIGMPLCFANITIETTVLLTDSPVAPFTYTVPVNPLFVGFEFYLQAFVPDPAAGNPMQAQVTGSAKAHVGSR